MVHSQHVPNDMDGGFKDTPFIAGSFTGRRAFRVVRMGGTLHLWGSIYSYEWSTHDVNTAGCAYHNRASAEPHKVASMSCYCGFFAYFQETPETRTYRNSVRDGFGVEGAIFGFGRATVGSLGFRCSKARVLGLVVPDQTKEDEYDMVSEAMETFNGVRWYGTIDALVRDWPLTKAETYGLPHPGRETPDADVA